MVKKRKVASNNAKVKAIHSCLTLLHLIKHPPIRTLWNNVSNYSVQNAEASNSILEGCAKLFGFFKYKFGLCSPN